MVRHWSLGRLVPCYCRLETKNLKSSNERLRKELEKYEAIVEDWAASAGDISRLTGVHPIW